MNINFILATITAGSLKARMVECVEQARWLLVKDNILFLWYFWNDDGKAKGRNILVSEFLKNTNIPYLIFIDGDMVFSPAHLKRLYQDLESGYDLISGVYCLHGGQRISSHLPETNVKTDGKIYEFQYIGTGFMGISRRLLEKIKDELSLPLLYPQGNLSFWPFFEETRREGQEKWGDVFTSEDHNFCDKAHQVGVKSYTDTSIILGHLGDYNWTLDDFALYNEQKRLEQAESAKRVKGELIPFLYEDMAEFFHKSIAEIEDDVVWAGRNLNIAWRADNFSTVEDFYRNNELYIFDGAMWQETKIIQETRLAPLSHLTGLKLLDFGCGIGIVCEKLAEQGNDVIGYDINNISIDFANFRKRKHNFKPSYTTQIQDLGQFDLIIALDVFEHIRDLHPLIRRLGKEMKSGSKLYHYDAFLQLGPMHFNHSNHITEWLEGAGFEVLDSFWAVKK